MNPDTTPTPRTDAIASATYKDIWNRSATFMELCQTLELELTETTNEASNWHQHYRDEASKAQKCKQAFIEKEQEVTRLRKLMREYIDFMDENLGTTADWPMEWSFDDGDVCQRSCDLLNAMKREVKPEDIN